MEQLEDALNIEETSYVATITHEMWMHHAPHPSWGAKPSKHSLLAA
jgi:hypothetical protein